MQKHTRMTAGCCQNSGRKVMLALLWGWLGLLGFDSRVWAATVTATVDRPTITLGEQVTLSLSFNGVNAAQPSLPAIPNLPLVGTGSSFSFDSSRGAAQQIFTYQLAPAQVGDFVIPAFAFKVGNENITTQPIQIKVVKPGDALATPGTSAPTAFVRLITPKTQLYVGEVSEVQVEVYFQEGRITQYPQLTIDSGLTVGKWLKPVETRATISNQVYSLVIFKQPVTPVKSGGLNLGPATVSLLVADRTRRADFFFGRPEREVRLAADVVRLQALPIPTANAPASFAGAVGSFTLAVTAGPTNLTSGDPITVKAQIQGRGALDAVQLPPQAGWTDFKTYPPTSQIQSPDPNNNSGTKTFEQVVIPERAGIKALPPLVFSFFDPNQRAFRTLTGPAIPLTVGPSTGGTAALPSLPGNTNASPAQPASDLAHIKPYLGSITPPAAWITRPLFLGLQLVPPAVWLGLWLVRQRRERLARDPRLRRRNEVAQKVRQGLGTLRTQAAGKDSDGFFATLAALLQEQIGERADLPASSITEAVVEEGLRPAGAPDELCAAVHELFQMCNLARYAPVKSSEALSAVVPKLEQALRGLQQWEGKR